ncbi:V-type ATP synthase subunit A [Acholeplasma equirhinis]|uniref:V-type ATP synthase subunit A n=1 Tax=Acholeplasma equirhinis TaxID=555393 RepID=UPI00197A7538|nr:V-type ATP synthase subunit A [Acholeplasma equirhinis]MBN3491191.1 V-type ATP synthase subunit A [Acholeplasma equirhinis]
MENRIHSINGPVVKVKNSNQFLMLEKVFVGPNKLMGEVISISHEETVIQVYETTTGLKMGDLVYPTGNLVSVTLGPGLMSNIFDGVQRPLLKMEEQTGSFIEAGSEVSALDLDKKWDVKFQVKQGEYLKAGSIFAITQETKSIAHKMMIPPNTKGKVKSVKPDGLYTVNEVVLELETENGIKALTLKQEWPIKKQRPIKEQLTLDIPLITGQRVIDALFPIAKGGTAAIPGGFGTGKTMLQHQFAKWSDADIIVYIGCGERGNEMTQVLEEFRALIDPRTKQSLMDRTILIANTSNMPVAAREASIYTGLTIAEYYRDMGYHVAIMADSTSRWAEALREISGRLEEMPAEEGFPAYLPSRISQFYERAGYVENLNHTNGSVTIIGAVSPQGSDFSEPVTQNTKRFVRCFWALDKALAYQRHYAAINWNQSYSEYFYDLLSWFDNQVDPKFMKYSKQIKAILSEETALMEVVKLIGSDVLPDDQRLIIEIGKVIRFGFLQQNAFDDEDTYVPLQKQLKMMEVILHLHEAAFKFINKGRALSLIIGSGIFDEVIQMKYTIKNSELEKFEDLKEKITQTIESIF